MLLHAFVFKVYYVYCDSKFLYNLHIYSKCVEIAPILKDMYPIKLGHYIIIKLDAIKWFFDEKNGHSIDSALWTLQVYIPGWHIKTFVSSNISNWPIAIDQTRWWTTKFFYLIFDYVLNSPVFSKSDFIILEFILTKDLIILLLSLWFWLSISVNRNTKFDAKRWSILDANVLEQLFWQWYIT